MTTTSIRLDQELIDKATIDAKALHRTLPEQIEHWANIGKTMETTRICLMHLLNKPLLLTLNARRAN